jgi:two-component system cell cycle response regulator
VSVRDVVKRTTHEGGDPDDPSLSGGSVSAATFATAARRWLAALIAKLDEAADKLADERTDPAVRARHVNKLLGAARQSAEHVDAMVRDNPLLDGAGDSAVHPAAPAALPPAGPSHGDHQLRLLVVDDEVIMGRTAQRIFYDCDVVALDNATEALARIVAGQRFDLILCDLMMPTMTGMELYDELVRVAPEQAQRMVFVTGGATTARAHEFVATVPNRIVEKPFESSKLRELVRDLADSLGVSVGALLVVDDDPSALKLVVRWLTDARFTCVTESSGEAALDRVLAAPDRVDALVLDAGLPGMSGFEVVGRLRANPVTAAIPIVLITARELDDADIVQGVGTGAVDFMTKPSTGALLVARVRVACERSRAERELRARLRFAEEHATTDGLTGLMNRRAFDARLVEVSAIAARHREPLTLVILDLDHFKRINDTFGHLGGDQTLLYFARTLRRAMRAGDQAFRYGGEEFALLLPKTAAHEALHVIARIQRALHEQPLSLLEGSAARVTFSAGIASADAGNGFAGEELVGRADAALYKAKSGGRDRTELAD